VRRQRKPPRIMARKRMLLRDMEEKRKKRLPDTVNNKGKSF